MESIGCVGNASMAKALAALSVAPRHSFEPLNLPTQFIDELERSFVFIVAGLRFAPAAALLCGAVLPTTSLCLGVSPSQRQATDFGGNEVWA